MPINTLLPANDKKARHLNVRIASLLIPLCLFLSSGYAFAQDAPARPEKSAQTTRQARPPALERLTASVYLNSELKGWAHIIRMPEKDLLMLKRDMQELGLVAPAAETTWDGKVYVFLRSLAPKVTFQFDEKEPALRIKASAVAIERGAERPWANLSAGSANAPEKIVASVYLNDELKGEAFIFATPDKDILLLKEDAVELGLIITAREYYLDEKTYVSLRSMAPKVAFNVDEQALALNLSAAAEAFEKNIFDLKRTELKDTERPGYNSAFLNYSLNFERGDRLVFASFSAPHEAGARLGDWLFFSNFNYTETDEKKTYARLYTNLVRDYRGPMVRFTAGDFNDHTGDLGGGAVLGGLNVSRNYGLNPYFLRYSGADMTGVSVRTAEVELWSDEQLVSRQSLYPGNFEFKNIPLTAGSGNLIMVTRDSFGREERHIVPYYFSSAVLKQGLDEYSYSVGYQRRELGVKSASYEDPAVLMTHSFGFTDDFTGGVRAEAQQGLVSTGLLMHAIVRPIGFFDAAAAASEAETEPASEPAGVRERVKGIAWSLGYSNIIKSRGLNYRIAARSFSKEYANLATAPGVDKQRLETIASAGYSSRSFGSLGLSYTIIDNYQSGASRITAARYTRGLVRNLVMDVSASRTAAQTTSDDFFIMFRYLFGGNTLGSVAYHTVNRIADEDVSLQRSPVGERGFGYRLTGTEREREPGVVDGQVDYLGRYGVYSAAARSTDGQNAYSLRASGSIATVNGGVYLGQPVTDSFAVVKVGGLGGVDVNVSNTPVDKTNSEGELFLPRIQSYNENRIFVEDKDVPMGYSLKGFSRHISPAFRSGSFVEFEVEKLQAVSGYVFVSEGGVRRPADFWNLAVSLPDREEVTPLVRGGEFYLENIPPGTYNAVISKADQQCRFEMTIPKSEDIVANAGEVVCGL